MLKLFVFLYVIQLIFSDYTVGQLREQLPKNDNYYKFQFQEIRIIIFSLTENSFEKVKQRLKNKINHAMNGNIHVKPKET